MKHLLTGLLLLAAISSFAGSVPDELYGDWSLNIESGEAGWLRMADNNGELEVSMMVNVGSIRPLRSVEVKDGKIHVPLKTYREKGKEGAILSTNRAEIWSENGKLTGMIFTHFPQEDRHVEDPFTGIAIPPMPPAPDLSKIKWGQPINLFNGKTSRAGKFAVLKRSMAGRPRMAVSSTPPPKPTSARREPTRIS